MSYTPYYPGGWKDWPNITTPLTASALAYIEAGIGSASALSAFTLNGSTTVGATSVTLNTTPWWGAGARRGWILVDPYTTTAELRRPTSVNGATLTFATPLANTHTAGVNVLSFTDGGVPTDWFGAFGGTGGATDDYTGLQWGVRECVREGLWLDGNGLSFGVGYPLILPTASRTRRMTLLARSATFPADTTNAVLMNANGKILGFTAAAATDTVTCTAAHSMNDATPVILQGASLPAPLVAGRRYYTTGTTSTTFQLSATSGGAVIDLTTDGTGTVFCKLRYLGKQYIEDVTVDGQSIAGINGVDFSLQQQTDIRKFRVNNCPGFGYQLNGQQAEHNDVEIINTGTGLQLDDASFMHFTGLDIEQFQTGIKWITSGGDSCRFVDIHFEAGTGTSTYVDATAVSPTNLLIDGVHMSMATAFSQVGFDMAAVGVPANYDIRGVTWSSLSPASSVIAFRDNYVPKTVYGWDDSSNASANGSARGFVSPQVPTADAYHNEYGGVNIFGSNGQELRTGGNSRGLLPFVYHKAGTGQTGDLHAYYDSSGNALFEVTPSAVKVGGGAAIKKVLSATATFDPASTVDGATWTTTVTCTGATVTNSVARAAHSSITAAGWILYASVTAADTVTVVAFNKTGGTVDLASGTLRVVVEQF